MKIVVFGDEQRLGALENNQVVDLNRAFASYLQSRGERNAQAQADTRVPVQLEAFIAAGEAALDDARQAIEHALREGTAVTPASAVRLHAPWPHRRIACIGGNYAEHLRGMAVGREGGEPPSIEAITRRAREAGHWGFWKVPAEVAATDDEIPFPRRTRYLDYEGEAAIVIGKRGKDIPADRLTDYIWGVTLVNDWSIRDDVGQPRAMSYNLAKNFDRSTSLGPCIVVGELDAWDVDVETRVNGEVRQRFNTRDMVFTFAETLEFLSRDFTFVPGDIISGGTGSGTAADSTPRPASGPRPLDRFLKPGDVVEVTSPRIGVLRNRVVQG